MKRNLLRIGLGVVAMMLVVVTAGLVDFYLWRSDIIESIETDARRTVAATARGDVEYAIEGAGVPMLVLHGSIGGYDSALQLGSQVDNVQLIAVSRAGYLGTPLSSGATYEEQADLYAALLDELGIDRVLVFAGSAGGPFGMQFALRHPDRTLGLMLVATGLDPDEENDVPRLGSTELLLGDMFMWFSARFSPALLMNSMSGNFDTDAPDQVARAKALAKTLVPMARRWEGNINDGVQDANPAVRDWPLSENVVPTLIIHGDSDLLAPYENATTMVNKIANATLLTIPGGGHAGFTGVQAEIFKEGVDGFIQSAVTRQED